jgi:hypothetical protein
MRAAPSGILASILAVCAIASPLLAHHGSAVSYVVEVNKLVTMKGTVTEVVWRNPHVFILYDVKDDKGNVVRWSAETSSPTSMIGEHGWSRATVKPGDEVTMTVFPSRAGTPAGLLYKVVAASGKLLLQDESRLPRPGRPAAEQ